jgi:hypothetical protein
MKKFILYSTALLAATVLGFNIISMNSIQTFATVERSTLESIDANLEACITELQANNTTNALSRCEISEQKLNSIQTNATVARSTESIYLPLAECIKQIQANNTTNALGQCKISEQEADVVLNNITGST